MRKNTTIATDYSKEYINHIGKLNAIIGCKFPHVKLSRGKGYYFIYSNDEETALKIAGLYQSGIYGIYNLKDQSVQRWLDDIEILLKK